MTTTNLDKYQIINGTAYKKEAPGEVIKILEDSRTEGRRITITYGDIKTGKSWNKGHPTHGYVGRASDTKLPILLLNKHAGGGVCIMDASVLEIKESKGGRVLYKREIGEPTGIEETLGEKPI